MRHKRWFIPLAFLLISVALFIAAMGWAVVSGVAIPDQDPTPAMQAHTRFHERIVDAFMLGAGVVLAAAVVSALVVVVTGRACGRTDENDVT